MSKVLQYPDNKVFPIQFTNDELDCFIETATKQRTSTFEVIEACIEIGLNQFRRFGTCPRHEALSENGPRPQPNKELEDYR